MKLFFNLNCMDVYTDRSVRTYSGGNMRRLSMAVHVFYSQPSCAPSGGCGFVSGYYEYFTYISFTNRMNPFTSSVDSHGPQFLWYTINKAVSITKHVVLLTTRITWLSVSQSLCTRIGIKLQRLYTLRLKVTLEQKDNTIVFVVQFFPSAILKVVGLFSSARCHTISYYFN